MHTKLWPENVTGRQQWEVLDVDERTILTSILRKKGEKGCI
jgi:hypothetical protein